MSRKAKPHDNATVESCVKTLRQEELYCSEYRASAKAALRSGAFSIRCTTRSAGIQRWATARRRSSSKRCCHSPLPAAREKKCCEAWDNLSNRQCRLSDAGRKAIELYAPPYRLDEFQLAVPWRVALRQNPSPLHRPGALLHERAAAGYQKPSVRPTVSKPFVSAKGASPVRGGSQSVSAGSRACPEPVAWPIQPDRSTPRRCNSNPTLLRCCAFSNGVQSDQSKPSCRATSVLAQAWANS